jgi:hypothetical protein
MRPGDWEQVRAIYLRGLMDILLYGQELAFSLTHKGEPRTVRV